MREETGVARLMETVALRVLLVKDTAVVAVVVILGRERAMRMSQRMIMALERLANAVNLGDLSRTKVMSQE